MIYFDTNILVHSVINQDDKKRELAQQLISSSIKEKVFVLSTLSIQEFVFVLSKLNVENKVIYNRANFFTQFIKHNIDNYIVIKAVSLCSSRKNYRLINDTVHLFFAERYCNKLLTFDQDFKHFSSFSEINVEILK